MIKLNEDGFPGGIGVGLVLPNGYINGAPTGSSNESSIELYDPISEIIGKVLTDESFKEFVTEYLDEAPNKALDQDISYTNAKGQQKKIKARSALRLPKEHPAHIEAAKIVGPADAPVNEPKKKVEPAKSVSAPPTAASQPGQPVKKAQTQQGKIDKDVSAVSAGDVAAAPNPQALNGVELTSNAEKAQKIEKSGKTKEQYVKRIGDKIKTWSEEEKKFFKDKVHKGGSPERRSWSKAILDKAKGAGAAIMHGLKHEANEFKAAGNGISKLMSGGKLDDHDKKAMYSVGKKIAITALFAAAGGGLAHGLAGFAKHVAMELVPHAVGEVVLGGVSKAAMFAEGVNEATQLNIFAAAIAERLENMDIKPDVMEKMIDDWNTKKLESKFKLNENLSETKEKSINHFVEFATKRLKLKERPKVTLIQGKEFADTKSSLGGYNPQTKEIYVAIEGRLGADILRTIAHEMVHRKQDELGLIKDNVNDGADGSPIENQAHAVAGILMREYGRINKQIYTETIKKVGDKYVVYPKNGGDRLGTHSSLTSAKKQLAAIEINKENITLDVDKGDTILMGKFKNKKTQVKDIGKDQHDMPTINGRQATTFRKVDEMGSKDIHFKNIISYYDNGTPSTKKLVSLRVCGNKYATRSRIVGDLRNMGYDEITDLEKQLKIQDLDETLYNDVVSFIDNYLGEVSVNTTQDSQPDGAWLPKGKQRKLNGDDGSNKSDEWYENGGYTQTDFPEADTLFGDEDADIPNVKYSVKNLPRVEFTATEFITESLLTEGGAAGHLAHPFEDADLSFADMKEMINRGLIGGLDKEAPVTEKLDGQNIAFSVKNGKIVFGRNKGHVRDAGKNALDVKGIAQQFKGRGNIEKAFVGAAEDLQAAVKKLSPDQVNKMFSNGSKFMSLEIILPDTTNVIPYGRSVLVMHGTIKYDKNGEQLSRSTKDGHTFANAVQKVGADRQKTFGIEGPKTIAFSDDETKEYTKKAKEFNSQLENAAKQFGLGNNAKLADYRRAWWKQEIENQEKKLGIKFSNKQKSGLIKRWSDGDKSLGIKDFDENAQKEWFKNYELSQLAKSQKQMIKPIETTFLNAGAQSLKRVTNFLASNNPKAADVLRKETLQSIKGIRDSKDIDKIAKLQIELERLDNIGMDKIVPSEGVVFQYNGKPYKFTGAFAPINQIQGTFKFDKPKKQPTPTTQTTTSDKDGKAIAIFTGRFQPFHAGHYSIYNALVNKFGKENVYIASSNVIDPVKSPFPFRDKKEIMHKMFDIPANRIVNVKNPYAPVEILEKFPPETAYVTAVSQKDAERLEGSGGKYFKNFESVPAKKRKGYGDEGYFIVAPEMKLKVNGENISGTQLRATFGSDLLSLPEKKKIFTQVYPKFDKDVFAKIVNATKKAEIAKKSTQTNPPPQSKPTPTKATDLKSKIKSLDPKTQKRVQKVLQTKIKNPDTGNTILVKSALKYDDKMRVKKMAVGLVKQAIKSK